MLTKFKALFSEMLEIDPNEAETASTETLENWDSMHHMNLITALEDEFDIELEPGDVVEMTSYPAALEMLKKYGVDL